MIEVERLEEWLGQDVIDPTGAKAGRLEEVYLDGSIPVLAAVKTGGLRRKLRLVPLDATVVGRSHVRVAHPVAVIGEAPEVRADAAPDDIALRSVAAHYGVGGWPEGLVLEGSKARAARIAAADAAEARARQLEDEARRQAEQAAAAQQQAAQLGRSSAEAEAAQRRAVEEAEAARAAAERARAGG